MIAKTRGAPGAEDGSEEETEAEKAQVAGLQDAFFDGLGGGVRRKGLVEGFGYVTEIAGDKGGVVGEAVNTAEAGDLDGDDVRDGTGEMRLRVSSRGQR